MTRGEEGPPSISQPVQPMGMIRPARRSLDATRSSLRPQIASTPSGWLPDIVWNKAVDVPEQVPQRLGCCLDAAVAADRQADDNLVDLRRHRRGGARRASA